MCSRGVIRSGSAWILHGRGLARYLIKLLRENTVGSRLERTRGGCGTDDSVTVPAAGLGAVAQGVTTDLIGCCSASCPMPTAGLTSTGWLSIQCLGPTTSPTTSGSAKVTKAKPRGTWRGECERVHECDAAQRRESSTLFSPRGISRAHISPY